MPMWQNSWSVYMICLRWSSFPSIRVLKKNDGDGVMVQNEMTHVTWCYNDVVKKWGQNTSIINNDFMCGSSWI
jgi:hypothetical protein